QRDIALEEDRLVGTHRERRAKLLGRPRIADRQRRHLAAPLTLLQLQSGLHRELVVGVDDVLDPRKVRRRAVSPDLDPRLRVRDALDADDTLHPTCSLISANRCHGAPMYLPRRAMSSCFCRISGSSAPFLIADSVGVRNRWTDRSLGQLAGREERRWSAVWGGEQRRPPRRKNPRPVEIGVR